VSAARSALITGASRGIGAAIAARIRDDGWTPIDFSRTTLVDVTNRLVLDQSLDEYGDHADALIYCAGHVDPTGLDRITDDAWDYQLEVNLTAAFRCVRWFARQRRPGAIVLVASTAGQRPSPNWSAYAASKAALINLAHTAAAELADRGIRVYCVAPGRCATQLRGRIAPDEDPTSIMQPDEVARVVAHLLADLPGVLAGQTIEVARR